MNSSSVIRSLVAAALYLPGLTTSVVGQGETPEAVVEQMMGAMKANDWARATSLMHPMALHQVRIILDPILTTEGAELDSARQLLFGLSTRAAGTAASDSALMVSLLRFAMSQQPNVADALRTSTFHVLGSVREGSDTVHVVGRMSMTVRGTSVSQIDVTSVVRAGASWRCLLKGDWTEMASRLRQALLRNK